MRRATIGLLFVMQLPVLSPGEEPVLKTPDADVDGESPHWAFTKPRAVEPPRIEGTEWPRDDIDRFVLSRLEASGLTPVADASRRTLVRRIYFDLIGLPPSPEQVEESLADKTSGALASLVDRLLDSPRFGERWGRHWLDVVRYAESSGMEFNFTYPHSWPYRDYVIDSFNEDKPYDVFLREQIAGDLLHSSETDSQESIDARRIAPSILAFVPKRHNSNGMEFRMDVVDAQIDTVLRSTLALTVACARCHDHKFDPIPNEDYYALAGIFLSTEPLYGTIRQKYSNNPTDLLPIGPEASVRHQEAEEHEKQIAETKELLAAKRSERKEAVDSAVRTGETSGRADALAIEIRDLVAELEKLEKAPENRPTYAMSARDSEKPTNAHVAIRGDFRRRGKRVARGFLSAVRVDGSPKIDPNSSGRLELAHWITSPRNPLTARVLVNRVWHHLFGRGIVTTVDNFGKIGARPSHPQLLDTLAIRFVDGGWSVKRLIRTIVLSRAYQLSSARDPSNTEIDPDNRLLWRATPRRLEAEAIRDAILSVSGQLDLSRPAGSTVRELGDQLVRGISPGKLQPPSRYRSVYLPIVRDYVPELFDLFDFPSPSLVSGRRAVTNVPAQSLYLSNSTFVAEQARNAAKRLVAATRKKSDGARVDIATRWALARPATEVESAEAQQLVRRVRELEALGVDREVEGWSAWFHTLFSTAEFRYLVDAK